MIALFTAAAAAEPLEPADTAWSLVASVGLRAATAEGLAQGVRFSQAANMGVVLWTADAYVGVLSVDPTGGDGLFTTQDTQDVSVDRSTFGTSLGLRSAGVIFGQVSAGIEVRTVDHLLRHQGAEVGSFRGTEPAVPLRIGLGSRSGRWTPLLGGWVRLTPDLPVTLGVELDLGFTWARERRGPTDLATL